MDRPDPFYRQAELLVRALPCVARRLEFALKGGTAINFFFRNLPRLSVDIDLTYLPLLPCEEAMPKIRHGLHSIAQDIARTQPRLQGAVGRCIGCLAFYAWISRKPNKG